jgi:hypothetical protein
MPDNASYLQAAYVVGAVIFLAYTASILWRRRALRTRHPGPGETQRAR